MKNNLKNIFKLLGVYLIYVCTLSTLYYYEIFSSYLVSSVNLIFIFLATYFVLRGLPKKKTHAFLIFIIMIILLNLIFVREFTTKTLSYYFLIMLSYILASKKQEKKKKLWANFFFILIINWYKNYITFFSAVITKY